MYVRSIRKSQPSMMEIYIYVCILRKFVTRQLIQIFYNNWWRNNYLYLIRIFRVKVLGGRISPQQTNVQSIEKNLCYFSAQWQPLCLHKYKPVSVYTLRHTHAKQTSGRSVLSFKSSVFVNCCIFCT